MTADASERLPDKCESGLLARIMYPKLEQPRSYSGAPSSGALRRSFEEQTPIPVVTKQVNQNRQGSGCDHGEHGVVTCSRTPLHDRFPKVEEPDRGPPGRGSGLA